MAASPFQEPETPETSSATTQVRTPGSDCGTLYEKIEIVGAKNSAMDELAGLASIQQYKQTYDSIQKCQHQEP